MIEKDLQLTSDDGHGFRPPCFAELNSYTGAMYHDDLSLPHPIAILNHSWGAVCQKIAATIEALEKMQDSDGSTPGAPDAQLLLSSYEALLHASDEFIENIEKNITKALAGTARKVDILGPASLRKIVSIPCNRMKHNHNRLTYYEVRSSIIRVSGFALCHVHKGVLRPNPEFHSRGRGSSFNAHLRKIIAALYFYTETVGQKIKSLSTHSAIIPVAPDAQTVAILGKITKLPIFSMPHETERDMSAIDFDGKQLNIFSKNTRIAPIKNGMATALLSGDGHTRGFAVP